MPRALWFVAGAGAGVYAVTRARRLAEALSADGLRDRVEGLLDGARVFGAEVRTGAAEREVELRERYGLPAPGSPPTLGATDPRPGAHPDPRPGDPH